MHAERNAATHTLEDDSQAHSFRTLREALAPLVCNTGRTSGGDGPAPTFQLITSPTPKPKHALDLLETITA